ncbi:PolC-type DNA polymerase III [Nanoarchaeota archaeon]
MEKGDKKEYVVVDIETTGLSKYYHKITEIAACRVCDGEVVDEFQSLVNPETRIPRFITRLTGIDDDMVKDAPKIGEVMPRFLEFLSDGVLVAHNATFDYGFLNENAYSTVGKQLENEKLCTRKLANRILNDLPSKKLGCLCEHYDVVNEQAHRAMGDVRATIEVFNRFLGVLEEAGVKEHSEIRDFEKSPIRKCRELL